MTRTALMLGMMVLVLSGCRATLPAEFEDCREESYAVLAESGIDPGRVRGFSSTPDRSFFRHARGGGNDRIVGYWNWLRLDGCDGAIVMRFSRTCRLRHVFVRGDCGPEPARAE